MLRTLDIRNCQYNVAETTRQGRFGPPQSGKRLIDSEPQLIAKLETHIKEMRKESLKTGIQAPYLFPGITQRMVQTTRRRACLADRLRTRSPHDLRHSYATTLLMAHISPAYVRKQSGHHSISMTVDIHGHWIPGEGSDLLDKALRPKHKPGNSLMLVMQGQE